MQFASWEAVYEQLSKEDPKADVFYMISTNKGTADEERTRFMKLPEAVQFVAAKLGRVVVPT